MLTDDELHQGFTREDAERMRREARERWGADVVEASEQRLRRLSKAEWAAIGREGEAVNKDLAALLGRPPSDPAVQAVVSRHRAWIEHFWTPDANSYRALGHGYVEHPDFRAFYERIAPGLAVFLRDAIDWHCDHSPEQPA